MKTLSPADLPALYPIYFTIFPRAGQPVHEGPLDHALADLLEIPHRPYGSSIEAAYELLDLLVQDEDYVNINYREYRQHGYVICDINEDVGGFTGSHTGKDRAHALFGALVSALMDRLETQKFEGEDA